MAFTLSRAGPKCNTPNNKFAEEEKCYMWRVNICGVLDLIDFDLIILLKIYYILLCLTKEFKKYVIHNKINYLYN